MLDPSHVYDLHHSSQQCQILNPLSKARGRTRNFMVPGQIHFHCATTGTAAFNFFYFDIILDLDGVANLSPQFSLILIPWSSHCDSVETYLTSTHEDTGLIPSLAQWIKDLVLPWAVVWVTYTAQIWHCCGCSVGQQLQLLFSPLPGNLHMSQVQPPPQKKDKKVNKLK